MKPLHLNLASRPYRDYRPVYAAVVAISLLIAFLMLNNVDTYYRYVHETRTSRSKIASLEQQIQQEREKEASVRSQMAKLDLDLLNGQTRFINARLAERAFSWSTLLDDLESVLADDVRLLTITPAFDEKGEITLTMQFESKSSSGMITTINRMNANPHFSGPFPSNESVTPAGYAFALTAKYMPPGGLAFRKVNR